MLIDEITIEIKAGEGGRGKVAFNRIPMSLGPTGGDGGNGGSVYFEGISDISALSQFRNRKYWQAENGETGKVQYNDGRNGRDLVLKIPIGTVIHNLTVNKSEEIIEVGQKILLAKGGWGGKGNFKFRSATNTSPKQFTHGKKTEKFQIGLELKLIATIGLIGLPNAGKSSLLNELTPAQSKVANYPFTTLEPNLGAYYGLIIADIPGLIEGASKGKGLGIKFLRHIERTDILFHLISAESENPTKDYKVIKKELGNYAKELTSKKEYLFLSKSDMTSKKDLAKKINLLKKLNKNILTISIHDWESIEKVKKILNKIKDKN